MRHHRACKGKAHASGIGKQLGNKGGPVSSSTKIAKIGAGPPKLGKAKPAKEPRKPTATTVESVVRGGAEPPSSARKLSRNSTSSWEYSDSDSLNSSEPGLSPMDHHNNGLHDRTNSMIRRIDRVLDDIDNAKCIYENHGRLDKMTNGHHHSYNGSVSSSTSTSNNQNHNQNNNHGIGNGANKSKSPLTRGSAYSSSMRRPNKKETWADSLRSGLSVDDRIKKMEEGWDDSNVIKIPRERKCHRITAEIENDPRELDSLNKRNSLCRRSSSAGKVIKRSRGSNQAPLYDVVEWEELLEMALTTRNGQRKRESHQRNAYDRAYLKDLEELRSSVAPSSLEVSSQKFF
jgi:hypothetical protein